MGAWNEEAFGNDAALDTVSEIIGDVYGSDAIWRMLQPDQGASVEAIYMAAETVAYANRQSESMWEYPVGVSGDIKEWLQTASALNHGEEAIRLALVALDRVDADDLKRGWTDLLARQRAVQGTRERLQAALGRLAA